MEFFDSLIKKALEIIQGLSEINYAYDPDNVWKDVGVNQVILQKHSAFELSGTGFNLITSSPVKDGITVIGNELADIKKDCSFTRISIIQIEDTEDEQKLYNLIRKTEYVKYHYFPDGYMIRTSSRSHKEAVRVSKDAVKKGISFQNAGNLLINKYKENPAVKGVRVIFITSADADHKSFEEIAQKNNAITETLNHIMNNVNFDCDTCNLKPVCDEVEGMRELHFRNKGM
jgi:CO dehydrogenase/acetyl-CoA synthase beta subunit